MQGSGGEGGVLHILIDLAHLGLQDVEGYFASLVTERDSHMKTFLNIISILLTFQTEGIGKPLKSG